MADQFAELRARAAVQDRLGEKKTTIAKRGVQVPVSPEREYVRVVNGFMRLYKRELEKMLPELKKEYAKQRRAERAAGTRQDSADDFMQFLTDAFARFGAFVLMIAEMFDLRKKIEAIGNLTVLYSTRQWKEVVFKSLGIDIREDYYTGEFFREVLDLWTSENVDLIVTIPRSSLGNMKDIVYKGWETGLNTRDIAKLIEKEYHTEKWHAQFIARDQMAKLNAKITKKEQEDAGVSEYIWDSSEDERVRPDHREKNGHRFRWDDPPMIYNYTRSGGIRPSGRKCHPGEDFQCRCVALPVFDYDALNFSGGLGTAFEERS